MRQYIPQYRRDQRARLYSIERFVLGRAESAGETKVMLDTAELKWVLEVAKRAPRSSGGRPSNSLQPKWWREARVVEAREKIVKLKADGKKPGGKPPTDKQISAIISETASDLNVKESYVEDLLKRKAPRKKTMRPASTP
jgi:hypothetical protein